MIRTRLLGFIGTLLVEQVAEMGDRLATIDMGRNVGSCCAPFRGELGPHLTQCRLGGGLPPYQMAY